MVILVTGGDGQLGQSLRKISGDYPAHRFLFTDLPQGDISHPGGAARMIAESGASLVVNCAAYTAVDRAQTEPEAARRANAEGPGLLGEAAREAGIPVIHISTDYVFGGGGDGRSRGSMGDGGGMGCGEAGSGMGDGSDEGRLGCGDTEGSRSDGRDRGCGDTGGGIGGRPWREGDTPAPTGVYGHTKLEGEQALRRSGCAGAVIRTSWLYSEFGNNFVKTMLRLGGERGAVGVVDDQTGSPTYATDLARAIMVIAERGVTGFETYHFCNSGQVTWCGFAREVFRRTGMEVTVGALTTGQFGAVAPRPRYSVLDTAKIRVVGAAVRPWEEALAECLEFFPK